MTASVLMILLSIFCMFTVFCIAWRAQTNERLLAEKIELLVEDAFKHLNARTLGEKVDADVREADAVVKIEMLKDALKAQHEELAGKNRANSVKIVYTDDGRPLNLDEWEIA